jgi:hypothetical protein
MADGEDIAVPVRPQFVAVRRHTLADDLLNPLLEAGRRRRVQKLAEKLPGIGFHAGSGDETGMETVVQSRDERKNSK